jgi:hypothetical protein
LVTACEASEPDGLGGGAAVQVAVIVMAFVVPWLTVWNAVWGGATVYVPDPIVVVKLNTGTAPGTLSSRKTLRPPLVTVK